MTAWRVYAVVFSILAVFNGLGRFVIVRKKPEAVSRMDLVEASVSLFTCFLVCLAMRGTEGMAPSVLDDRRTGACRDGCVAALHS